MKKNNFENQISNKFEGFSVKPPEVVWSNVEKQITDKNEKGFFGNLISNKYFLIVMLGVSSASIAYHLNNNPFKIEETFNQELDLLDSVKDDKTNLLKDKPSDNQITIDFKEDDINNVKLEKPKSTNVISLQSSLNNDISYVSDLNKQLIIVTEHFVNNSNGLYNVKMSLSDTSNIKYVDWVCREYDFYSSNMTLPIAFADSAESYDVEAVVTFKDNDKKLFSTEVNVMKSPKVVVPQNFNPNRQSFYIRSENLTYFKIEIINPRTDRVVFKSRVQNKKWDGKDFLGKNCEPGEYLVEINFKGSSGEIRTEITKLKLSY